MFKTFTRGGQVTLHNVRMIRQVVSVTLGISLILGALSFFGKTWLDYTPYERRASLAYYWADFRLNIPLVRSTHKPKMTQYYTYEDGTKGTVYCLDIVNDKWHQSLIESVNTQIVENAWLSLWMMLGFFSLACGGWVWRGHARKEKEMLSGTEEVAPKKLSKIIMKSGKASEFTIAGVPLIRNSETQHMIFVGTTGTGKSTCFKNILPQIRAKGQRAVVIDTTGDFINCFYRAGKDILLNPFDKRSQAWHPWIDCLQPYHYDELAQGFVPQTSHDRFWSEASRTVLSETMQKIARDGKSDLGHLLSLLMEEPLKSLHEFLKDTPAASLTDPAGDKTALSIRSHLIPYLKSLRYIPKHGDVFSIRQWMSQEEGDSWLFIGAMPDQRETLRPLMTGWMTIAMNSLMSLSPDSKRRVWFLIDELASLQKQETLPKALAELRKYGGCIATGIQSIPQLQEIYGHSESKSLTSLFNTKVIFRSGDPESAKQLSLMLGEQEVKESNEGISYGAHQMRDGVSLNEQKRLKPVVSANDIMSLNDLEAYLRLSGNLPITKVKFAPQVSNKAA